MLGFSDRASAQAALARMAALDRSQAVIEFELDGTVVTANENFLRVLGYSLVEIQGKHHSLFVDAAERESVPIASSGQASTAASFAPASTSALQKAGAKSGSRPPTIRSSARTAGRSRSSNSQPTSPRKKFEA
jgi:hypothetical protein